MSPLAGLKYLRAASNLWAIIFSPLGCSMGVISCCTTEEFFNASLKKFYNKYVHLSRSACILKMKLST